MADASSSLDTRPWSKKRKMIERNAKLNEARMNKRAALAPLASPETSDDPTLPPNVSEVPDPSETEDPGVGSESEYESEPEDDEFTDENAQAIFDDFIVALPLDDRRMLAVVLTESFIKRQKMRVKDAAQEAGSIVGFNEPTVRKYRSEFFENKGELNESKQGKYMRSTVYRNEEVNHRAAEWVRENAFVKGKPNMTAQSFCEWVNNHLLPSSHLPPHYPRTVSLRTAIRWLHHLGFKPVSHKKGVYIDGHEREDVIKHREQYLKTMDSLHKSHKPPPLCSDEPPRVRQEEDEDKKQLVLLYHDESIYNTNEGQTWMWGEEERPALLPKSKGSGIMVSDFVSEHDGLLELSEEQHAEAKKTNPEIPRCARVRLEYGLDRGGYWTGDRFMKQIKDACDIAAEKYSASTHTVVFILDQSSCHKKFDEYALTAKRILKKDGRPRRVRDTVWAGNHFPMVNPDGTAKGLETILKERGFLEPALKNLKADNMRTILSFHEDFFNEKTQVEHYIESRGYKCYFLPKFHCELNPIERVWGQSKCYCRAYTNFTLQRLREIIVPALESISVDLIRKYFRKVREYERAYLEGYKAGKEVENAVKKYKSHRRVFTESV